MTHPITSLEFYSQGNRSELIAEELAEHDIQVGHEQATVITAILGDMVVGSALRTYWRPDGDDLGQKTYIPEIIDGSGLSMTVASGESKKHREELLISPDGLSYSVRNGRGSLKSGYSTSILDLEELKSARTTIRTISRADMNNRKVLPTKGDLIIAQRVAKHDLVERAIIDSYTPPFFDNEPVITGFNVGGKRLILKERLGWGWTNFWVEPEKDVKIWVPTFDKVPVPGGGEKIVSHEHNRITKAIVDTLVNLSIQ